MSRRRFVQGLAASGVLAGIPTLAHATAPLHRFAGSGTAPVLKGTEITLVVAKSLVNFTGTPQTATTINGSIPAPTLRLREGDEVTIHVTNRMREITSIHWHGVILPYQMDGVPGISFNGIAPGETFTYRFRLRQSGTYWYHSHVGTQEMTGMYGALIIEPRRAERFHADRDYIVQLSDWTGETPMRAFASLKKQSAVYNLNPPTVQDFFADLSQVGLGDTLNRRRMWNRMRMHPTDLADLSSAVLTYLVNGTTPEGNWTALFHPGERVRLRCINSSGNSFYDLRIPGLKMTVVQADGQDVEPVTVDEFRFGPGETYDVIIGPEEEAYTLFAQGMDRTGFACGTLAARPGLSAPIPALDPVTWLTPVDMMGAMQHGTHMHGHGKQATGEGMHHANMAQEHGAHANHGNPLAMPSGKVRHARTEYGPSVDMRVDAPRTNLDDPGIGLRDNGRRVLTLDDLHTIGGARDARIPVREIELHLTGNMERYSWSFDGLEFGASTPVHMRHNERLRVILQNDTMMTHPMHLHGLWSEQENDRGRFMSRRHTIPVQPAQRISFLVTADALGRWAWHCHLMFHMTAGMFREVVIS